MTRRRMPAEWEDHERCWMIWPDAPLWEDELEPVQREYTGVAHAIRNYEPLSVVTNPHSAAKARDMLGADIEVVEYPVDDAWCRDCGPSFVIEDDARLAGVCWRFNGWGGANTEFQKDAALGRRLTEGLGGSPITSALSTEGGNIAVDGQGTLITTDSVTFNTNRNPGLTRPHAEAEFARTLGIEKVIWLPGNDAEHGTNGHIDGIACFTKPGTVLFELAAEGDDSGKVTTEKNFAALEGQTDAQGRPLEFITIREAPTRSRAGHGDWGFCSSYVNFYIANGGLVIPGYGIPEDAEAYETLAAAFPDRSVTQVPVTHITRGGGGIHCITQQQPKL